LVLGDSYYDREHVKEAELTSFGCRSGWRALHVNIVTNSGRSEVSPDSVYESTAANRKFAQRYKEIIRQIAVLEAEKKAISEKKMERVKVPSIDEVRGAT
jgi:hypothetical protein